VRDHRVVVGVRVLLDVEVALDDAPVGGSIPSPIARRQKLASIASAAANVWPIIDLVEDTGTDASERSRCAL
jgi:hypothetical protein